VTAAGVVLEVPLAVAFVPGIGRIDAAEWDACAGTADPFVSHAVLAAFEEGGVVRREAGWQPLHATVRDAGGRLVGAAPVYAKGNANGDYWPERPWADAFATVGGRYYPKLLVGVPFTPVAGPRLLLRPGAPPHTARTLVAGLERLARDNRLSSIHAAFLEETDRQRLLQAGWLPRQGVQYRWENPGYRCFADFLAALTPKRRGNILRERRAVAASGVRVRLLPGDRIRPADWDGFHRLYEATHRRRATPPPLTAGFFHRLGEAIPGRLLMITAEEDGVPAGCAVRVLGDGVLHMRHWGGDGAHRFLHFEISLYRTIEYAIEHGYAAIDGGHGGPHKGQRGFRPALVHGMHWFADPRLRDGAARFLEVERANVRQHREALDARSPYRTRPMT
jgi:predicted N-acyltransferase